MGKRKEWKEGDILIKFEGKGFCKKDLCIGKVKRGFGHGHNVMIEIISSSQSPTGFCQKGYDCQFDESEDVKVLNKLPKEEQERYKKKILAMRIKNETNKN
jgi:hypothetical protein